MQSGFDIGEKRRVRQTAEVPVKTVHFDSFADVPHNIYWADGQRIFVADDEYVFIRNSPVKPDGGVWKKTGGAIGAEGDW